MSDENNAGGATPPGEQQPNGAFDWLRESHQQSAPLAPLSDDLAAPGPAALPPAAEAPPSAPDPSPFEQQAPAWQQPPAPAATPLFTAAQADAPPAQQPPFEAPPAQQPPFEAPPAQYGAPAAWPVAAASAFDAAPVSVPSAATPAAPPLTPPPVVQPPAWDPLPPVGSSVPPPAAPPPAPPTDAAPPSQAPLIPRPSFMADHHQAAADPAPTATVPVESAPAFAAATSDPSTFGFAGLRPSSADVTPESFSGGGAGGPGFSLERHTLERRSGNGPLDWAALVLAIIAPPLGFIVAIVAVIVGSRTRGFAAGIAKAAIAIAVVLSIGLGVGGLVLNKMANDQAKHDAVVASSAAWCTSLKSNPATLSSSTYGWPAPADTIPDSITSMQAYVDYWTKLEAIAPTGIKTGTSTIAATAKSIVTQVTSTQTLDDASNVTQIQNAVSTSGVGTWVTNYCN